MGSGLLWALVVEGHGLSVFYSLGRALMYLSWLTWHLFAFDAVMRGVLEKSTQNWKSLEINVCTPF